MSLAASADFNQATSYALEKLKCSDLKLKPQQAEAIRHIYDGRDVFVWLPTGFGKSICYEVLPFMFDYRNSRGLSNEAGKGPSVPSLGLVISPLIALMVDQVRHLRRRDVRSAIAASGSGDRIDQELLASKEDMLAYSFLFCTPEAVVGSKWRDMLESPAISNRIVVVAVDEAHCVSKWSKEFRPAYGRLHEVRALVPPGVPFLACTATATRSVRQEVITGLDMEGCKVVCTSPNRPNIYYEVRPRTELHLDMQPLVHSLKIHKNKAPRVIVYCRTLNTCSDLYAHFHHELGGASYYPSGAPQISDNRLFGMYHSNTPHHNKDVILKSLASTQGVVRVVFATVALGMGVNFGDINTVIHYGAPHSIDDYFQESGRSGRSGANAKSVVYWKPSDCPARTKVHTTREAEVLAVRQYVENTTCRREWLLKFFDPACVQPCKSPQSCCDVCAEACQNVCIP